MKGKILLFVVVALLLGINLSGCAQKNPEIVEPHSSITSNNNSSNSLISNDFFIFWQATRVIPNNFPISMGCSSSAGCPNLGLLHFHPEMSVVSGDLIQISILIRDNGFKDYTVEFSHHYFKERKLIEIKGEETISTGGKNAVAFLEWRVPEIEFEKQTINLKVRVIPQEKITKDPDLTNNELGISFGVAKEAKEGFYYGIPASGEKKIGLVIFQEREQKLGLVQKILQKVFLKNHPSPLKELLNPKGLTKDKKSGELIPSIFYLKQFLSEESQRHTGEDLFPAIEVKLMGPYCREEISSGCSSKGCSGPISSMREQATKQGVNLEKYDIIAYVYLRDTPGRSYALRDTREIYVELGNQGPKTTVLFHEIMHLFGASDHYDSFAKMSNPPDIMTDPSIMEINYFTAQEIGWADRNHNGIIDAKEPALYQLSGPSD